MEKSSSSRVIISLESLFVPSHEPCWLSRDILKGCLSSTEITFGTEINLSTKEMKSEFNEIRGDILPYWGKSIGEIYFIYIIRLDLSRMIIIILME